MPHADTIVEDPGRRNETQARPVQPTGTVSPVDTWDGLSADFNVDGREDVLVTTHRSGMSPRASGLQEDDGSFHLDVQLLPLWMDRHGCADDDVDSDGRVDFYCQTGVARGTEARPNELWIQ